MLTEPNDRGRCYASGRLALLILAAAAGAGGCGMTRGIAIDTLEPILDRTVASAYRSGDLETVREGIPGNLLLLQGLTEAEPGNERIRMLASQVHFSYAMGFVEDVDPQRAERLYAEGLRIGREGLLRKGWFERAERGARIPDPDGLREADDEDVPLLFWTVANWIGWIALNLDDPAALAQLGRAEAYLDRVLEIDPDYFLGMPHVLAGTLHSFRPRMFGGNPELGAEHFARALEVSGGRMLIYKVLYARYYCRQILDPECFVESLEDVLSAPEDLLPEYRLYNEVARRKAADLLEKQDVWF